MLKYKIRNMKTENRQCIVERIILNRSEVIEDNGDGRQIMVFEFCCVGAVEDVFSDYEYCDSGDSDVFLGAGLVVRYVIRRIAGERGDT